MASEASAALEIIDHVAVDLPHDREASIHVVNAPQWPTNDIDTAANWSARRSEPDTATHWSARRSELRLLQYYGDLVV
ncbi:hypothetical protein J6590_047571 [Homalodisca vitripennis]|nr:hypothetical protein J6590_047571 [Homalodisca vitripennis]